MSKKVEKMEKVWREPEPPPGFGDDEINRQLQRNAESFEEWYARNRMKMSFATVARFMETLRAAFYRQDL